MERARQMVGEMLIYCFVILLLTGGFLAFFYVPSGETVPYTGAYTPLHGIPMSAAYDSLLRLSFDVRGGLLIRHMHQTSSVLLAGGTILWALLGRFRYAFAVLGLGALTVMAGYGSADDLLSGTMLGKLPIPFWYGLHLLTAAAVVTMLVISSRREAARQPRTPEFIVLSLVLFVLVVFLL
ncbi:hypothetical protein ACIBCT_28765 [Streptosporangium sp. NPDC050855]|uniref:hypothetical protein n=1 Tax=Streptosporangium sp. NPDC050855 TaxID=3366194 RepID=UPI00378C4915